MSMPDSTEKPAKVSFRPGYCNMASFQNLACVKGSFPHSLMATCLSQEFSCNKNRNNVTKASASNKLKREQNPISHHLCMQLQFWTNVYIMWCPETWILKSSIASLKFRALKVCISKTPTMPKQASKVCLSLFIVLSLLANYSISAKPSDQSYASAESENKSISQESLPVLPNPDSPTTEAEAVAETLSPTYFSVPPSANIPDVETKSNETLSQENVSTLSNADEPTDLQITKGEENLSQELASPPSVNIDPTIETKGDENISTSLSRSNVDNSVLDTQDMDNLSQENTSLPLSKADPPAVETKESTEDLFQENTFLPPSPSVDVPAVETKEDENVSQENLSSEETKGNEILSQENTSVPSSPNLDAPGVEENKSPALAPAYIDTPALETSDDGSFTQDNQSPVTYVNAPDPETKGEQDISTQVYSSATATPPYTESQNPENVPKLNDYNSLPKTAVPAPSEALSFPESDPTIQMTPSNDYTFGLAPTSHQTILPFNYRAEDEPVEPYEDEEDSWHGVNGAVAGALVGACVIGVGGFVYQKRKKDNIRAQYQCLAKKGEV